MSTGSALSRSLPELDNGPQGQPILVQKKEPGENWTNNVAGSSPTTKVHKRRWIIVMLFCLYSMSNAYQWIHLNIIANIITKYYNASLPEDRFQRETTVDWLSMIYMLAYIPLIFPSTFLLNKKGLRVCAIAGAFLNALGAWLKVACISPDRFPVLMFAQTVCAIAQIFILGLPAKIAAVWFGPNEVSTATSLGVFGNQVLIEHYVIKLYMYILHQTDPFPNITNFTCTKISFQHGNACNWQDLWVFLFLGRRGYRVFSSAHFSSEQ